MASGCLGLISFPREPGRVTLERIDELYPSLMPGPAQPPGNRLRAGALGARRSRSRWARAESTASRTSTVAGEDPLAPFGPNAAHHLRRTDGFEHCPDIVVNSTYWEDTDEVAAFEELVGSHGGMGGAQSLPVRPGARGLGDAGRADRRRRGDAPADAALARGSRPRGIQEPGRPQRTRPKGC